MENLLTDGITLQHCKSELCFIESPLKVHTYDIDIAQHVNNIVYVRWLEDMRNELFIKLNLLESLLALNYYPVVASCEMRYKKQIKIMDHPVGRMHLESNSHGIMIFRSEIRVNEAIVYTATQKCVLMDLTTNKMIKRI